MSLFGLGLFPDSEEPPELLGELPALDLDLEEPDVEEPDVLADPDFPFERDDPAAFLFFSGSGPLKKSRIDFGVNFSFGSFSASLSISSRSMFGPALK